MRTGTSKQLLMTFFGSVAAFCTWTAAPHEANALGKFDIPYYSFVARQECVATGAIADDPRCTAAGYPVKKNPPFWVPSKIVWWEWDPPATDVTDILLDFYYNPSRFAPVVDGGGDPIAGFLCQFTSSTGDPGNCPTEAAGVGTQALLVSTPPVPGPTSGTSELITVNTGTGDVHVEAHGLPDITSTGEIFFAMKFEALFALDKHATVTYSTGVLPDADYILNTRTAGCITADPSDTNSCGSENYTVSARFGVPEPTGLAILSGALLAFVAIRRRRYKPAA